MKTYIKVLAVFAPMFIGSIVFESVPREWLGDWKCQGQKSTEIKLHSYEGEVRYHSEYKGCTYGVAEFHTNQPEWHWGLRRWIVIIAGLTLTGVSIYKVTDGKEN